MNLGLVGLGIWCCSLFFGTAACGSDSGEVQPFVDYWENLGKNERKEPEYLKINPDGRIPAIVDRGEEDRCPLTPCPPRPTAISVPRYVAAAGSVEVFAREPPGER